MATDIYTDATFRICYITDIKKKLSTTFAQVEKIYLLQLGLFMMNRL